MASEARPYINPVRIARLTGDREAIGTPWCIPCNTPGHVLRNELLAPAEVEQIEDEPNPREGWYAFFGLIVGLAVVLASAWVRS